MAWMTNTLRQIFEAMLLKWTRVFMDDGILRYIGYNVGNSKHTRCSRATSLI